MLVFIVALIVGAGVLALAWWMSNRGVKASWYEWLIGIVGLLLLAFTVQNYFGSMDEVETTAANLFLLVIGLPALVLLAVASLLVWRRHRAAKA